MATERCDYNIVLPALSIQRADDRYFFFGGGSLNSRKSRITKPTATPAIASQVPMLGMD
jgi:hypothetical protein